MKKYISIILTMTLLLMLSACGSNTTKTENSTEATENTAQTTTAEATTDNESTLIMYFSWSGNTKAVAEEIQLQTGADIFEITPETPYPEDYNEVLDVAKREQDDNARPVIANTTEDFDKYDTVFVGYPNWWGDMPMIMYSLFDDYDFAGKTIAPFVTSGGSGFSGTMEAIKSAEPNANVAEGLSLSEANAKNSSADVSKWLETIERNKQ